MDFNEEEIRYLNIQETKQGKDDLVYIAVNDEEYIKEIHFRRAASSNDDLVTRDFIPPQYHARYMAIQKRAAEKRGMVGYLKTQVRWGEGDIEIYTKVKGSQEQFKEERLERFHGGCRAAGL